MLTFKQIERASKMFTDALNKHSDEIRVADFDWRMVELYDYRYPDSLIQQLVPICLVEFK